MDSVVKGKPKISVLMPVYNCEAYIKDAIDSILNQTFSDFELLIIDDASTDNTLNLIHSYNDSRIKLINKKQNTGLTNSLNMALSIAKGEYIARMDGDDISLPHRFEKQISFMDSNTEYALCGSNYNIIDTQKIVKLPEKHHDIKLSMLHNCCIAHPSVMIRKSIMDDNSIQYNAVQEPAEDYDLWVRLIVKGKFYNLQDALLNYRVHNSQISQKKATLQRDKSVDAKIYLLKSLNSEMSDEEKKVLRKILLVNEKIAFEDIRLFGKIKNNLKTVNKNHFFEENGFLLFLKGLEHKIITKYFSKNRRYNPFDFFQYLNIKRKFRLGLSLFSGLKLLVKSFLFYKPK